MTLDPRQLGKPSCFDDTSDSSSSRISQLLTHASRDVADDVSHAVRSHCGLHQEQTVALDHGHTEP